MTLNITNVKLYRENESERSIMRREQAREKENRLVRKIVTVVILSLVLIVTVLGIYIYKYWQSGLKPLNPKDDHLVQVNIPIGTSNKGIGNILEEQKIIKSGLVFTYYVKTENITDFKGGYYQMAPNMTLDEISEMLCNKVVVKSRSISGCSYHDTEGYGVDQIAKEVASKTGLKEDEILNVITDEAFFKELLASYPQLLQSASEAQDVRFKLEGYLFPKQRITTIKIRALNHLFKRWSNK